MKENYFENLYKKLLNDPRNAGYTKRNIPPIYQVSYNAKILIVGQAPGSHVEKSLIPFHDRSGETLMNWLGVNKEEFYSDKIAILPMDFYYPGKGKVGDLPPRKFIAKEYHSLFLENMTEIELTILIGKYAIDYYLNEKKSLTQVVKNYQNYLPQYFPIVHPSPLNFRWQKQNPWFKEEVVEKLQECVKNILEK